MLSAGLAFSVLGNLHSVADCNCCFAPCASHDLRIWNLKSENVQICGDLQLGNLEPFAVTLSAGAAGEFSQLIYPHSRGDWGCRGGRSVVLFTKN